jgi:hypothetical protein
MRELQTSVMTIAPDTVTNSPHLETPSPLEREYNINITTLLKAKCLTQRRATYEISCELDLTSSMIGGITISPHNSSNSRMICMTRAKTAELAPARGEKQP